MPMQNGTPPSTLFDKIWDAHVVATDHEGSDLIYIDRHLLQDGSRRKFDILRERGLKVRRPDLTFAAQDHYAPSLGGRLADVADSDSRLLLRMRQHTIASTTLFMSIPL